MTNSTSFDTLPTLTSAEWCITAFNDALQACIASPTDSAQLRLCFYAITRRGWSHIHKSVVRWLKQTGCTCVAIVGTDHGLTDPDALAAMRDAGVAVRLMIEYSGIFHPKVVWMTAEAMHQLWIGSNNLTEEGLLRNIECGAFLRIKVIPPTFLRWFQQIEKASVPLDDTLLQSYRKERAGYAAKQGELGAFTWSKRREPPRPEPTPDPEPSPKKPKPTKPLPPRPLIRPGDLITEVMPKETGMDGKQMQLPMDAAVDFFGLPREVGASAILTLESLSSGEVRSLTMTIFGNRTVRLSMNELDYNDRPCVIIFRRLAPRRFQYEIVQRALSPTRYRDLLAHCNRVTREGSRRWTVIR